MREGGEPVTSPDWPSGRGFVEAERSPDAFQLLAAKQQLSQSRGSASARPAPLNPRPAGV